MSSSSEENKSSPPFSIDLTTLIPEDWRELLHVELSDPYFVALQKKLVDKYAHPLLEIYPSISQIFRALELTPVEKVQVVIIGQDPYYSRDEEQRPHATGLAFHSNSIDDKPPSLSNIETEVYRDVGGIRKPGTTVNLEHWANQGVLLLNRSLTVYAGIADSHSDVGWKKFTSSIIERLTSRKTNLVFLLWGQAACAIEPDIQQPEKHCILRATHPSPKSYQTATAKLPAFAHCAHFKKCNEYLSKHGRVPISWISEAEELTTKRMKI